MERPYIMLVEGESRSAFKLDEDTHELLETVEFAEDGSPSWEDAGVCDTTRGEDPIMQEHIRTLLQDREAHLATA